MGKYPNRPRRIRRQGITASPLPARAIARPYARQRLLEEPEGQMRHLPSYRLGIWSLGFYWCLGSGIWSFSFVFASEPTSLIHTHAHNDYEHQRPLLDALDHGFCSVEADIYLVDGKLLVGHNRKDLRPNKTLETLYLEPLRERIRAYGGKVYRAGPTVHLLIDVKTEADA